MPVSYRVDVLLRTLCLAGVAFAPVTAIAQDAGFSLLPGGSLAPGSAPAPIVPEAPVAAAAPAAAAPANQPPVSAAAPPEQVKITAPKISSGVAAVVNDFVISDYDLDQRTALFVATSGVRPSKETLAQI